METLIDLPLKLASSLMALALILMALQGPRNPPSAPSAQMVFPFMAVGSPPQFGGLRCTIARKAVLAQEVGE